jgi:4-hydroxy-tetrahydrodipicolinate reductase
MKIALLGYGKMGKVIEKLALERGHTITFIKTRNNNFDGLKDVDIAIDFSLPEIAVENILACFEQNVPVISGTTGWLDAYEDVTKACVLKNGSFIYSANFSLGVNIFFQLNEKLAQIMQYFDQYKVAMEEIHHIQKLDKPSGTAIALANGIKVNSNYSCWTLNAPKKEEIFIDVKRISSVSGTHKVNYSSDVDIIEISHTALNRNGFALGALIAAEWLKDKKGIYSMKDVLSFN